MRFLLADPVVVPYAPIDLKLADIYVYDGFRVTGVTNTAEEPADETVIALTGCNEVVPVGCAVHFANDSTDTEYIVASRTLGSGTNAVFTLFLDTPTGGTFTLTFDGQTTDAIPYDATAAAIQVQLEALDGIGNGDVLVEVATDFTITFQDDLASTAIIASRFTITSSLTYGVSGTATLTLTTPGAADTDTLTITLTDGLAEVVEAGGAVTFAGRRLDIKVGEGNLTYSEKKPRKYILDRGNLDTVRNDNQEPMDVSLDFTWEWLTAVTASGVPTFEDVLKQRGEASAWETSDSADVCAPYCVDLVIYYDPGCGGDNTEKITLPEFRYEELNHDLKEATVAVTGKCNVTEATVTRGA